MIAYNCKFELSWLKACGFVYEGAIYDPMLVEYVLARGQKLPLSLEESCIRRNVSLKKSNLVNDYLKKNIGFQDIPWSVVEEYGIQDVLSCKELYEAQKKELQKYPHLIPTIQLMHEFCRVLVDIESNGIKIDVVELDRLETEYRQQLDSLKIDLYKITEDVMGATPINLDSPEQLSQVIYSRKVKDKHKWKLLFNLGSELRGAVLKPKRKPKMSPREFVTSVQTETEVIHKTAAEHCENCHGKGKIRKVKKDGSDFIRDSICGLCLGRGYILRLLPAVGGLKCRPAGVQDASSGGFSTDKETLDLLRLSANGTTREFLEKILELNKIETYLSTFIEGIRRGLREDNILHTNFMQTVTATGRLSSRSPNLQNMPRENTFPVRNCMVSRWKDGVILEADFSQLEFRAAGILSGNKQIKEDIQNKVDIHAETAKVIGCSRQDAKAFSFAPLYGSNPHGKLPHIARYYEYFIKKYDLATWHNEWGTEVINTGGYILPSGRELCFKDTVRYPTGGFSNATAIKNYKCQSFATADIVPLAVILVWNKLKQLELKSKIVLTIHDSVELDVPPDEIEIAIKLVNQAFLELEEECFRRWNYRLTIPLAWELKIGPTLLQLQKV